MLLVFSGDALLFDLAPDAGDPLRMLRHEFFADEIIHLLVGTAVANRVQLEHMSQLRADPEHPEYQPVVVVCGSLQSDVLNGSDIIPLTFEQACNKIIHAVHIVPDCGNPDESPLTSEVKLRGRRGKEYWAAYLNVPQYVRASVLNFKRGT